VTDKPPGVQRTAQVRGESPAQVLDRNLAELLQELRVVLTGVQILFAFLLALAFTADLDERGPFATAVYTVTLMSTACATVVLIAPVSFHRTVFRRQRKEQLVSFADRALSAGLALLLVGITSAVLLVLDVVLGRWPAYAGGAAVLLLGAIAWYALPLRQLR
jgi:hypothetical protein